jgi:uncharacterized membrane protein YgcG
LAWIVGWGVVPALAQQSWPPLDGVVADGTGQLDAGKINSAADQLKALGVKPLAVFVRDSPGYSNDTDFANAAAAHYNLASNNVLDPDVLAIVVVLNTRRSTILYGDSLKSAMERPGSSGTVADTIRNDTLNPALAKGDYTGAFVNSFGKAAESVRLYRNPLATATPQPAIVTTVDTRGIGNAVLVIGGAVIVLVLLVIGVPIFARRRRQAQEALARTRALRDQLGQARNVASDMLTSLDFPENPEEQIQYRFLELALEKERPEQLAQIRAEYDTRHNRLEEALGLYNKLEKEREQNVYTNDQQLMAAIAQYQDVQAAAQESSAFLQRLADLGREVEGQATAAPGEVDAAKKALAAATDALTRLAAAAPDLYHLDPNKTLKAASGKLAEAERALQSKPPQPLHAYDTAMEARGLAERIPSAAQSLAQAYSGFASARARLEQVRKGGYKLKASDAALSRALELLSSAAQRLEGGDLPGFARVLGEANQAAKAAFAAVDAEVARQAENARALAELQKAGEEIKRYIAEGAAAFDKVDEYAESAWQDIRGNGTEAQRAADHAYEMWQEASKLNEVSPDSEQDFDEARQDIEEGQASLAKARQLVAAILDRLQHLEESKRTAQAEIAAAERDVASGREFVGKHDPDITRKPDDMLNEAAGYVRQAKEEVQKPKPDWIEVVGLARQANDLADSALADARSQEEAMQARRLKVQTAAQQAAASLSRAENFASVHRGDVDRSVLDGIARARADLERAQKIAAGAQGRGLEDTALAKTLDDAAGAHASAQVAADTAFNTAGRQFAAMESQRAQAHEALQRADSMIRDVASYIRQNEGLVSGRTVALLQSAADALPAWRDGADTSTLNAITAGANEATERAQQAYAYAHNEIEEMQRRESARRQQEALQTLMTVGAIGAALSSGGRRRSGWGGPWGGGGSSGGGSIIGGGGGGGGGSSSGGWGGGGSSSGSFGGGGSSGGGWGGGGSSSGGW